MGIQTTLELVDKTEPTLVALPTPAPVLADEVEKAPKVEPADRPEPATCAHPGDGPIDGIGQLLSDIYQATGHKVTADDPIVAAALVQSRLVKQAGRDSARLIQDAMAVNMAQLADAVETERASAAQLDRTVAIAFQQIADGAKKMGDQELSTFQSRFARMASETIDQVRKEAAANAPGRPWWHLVAVLAIGLSAGLAGGVFLSPPKPMPLTGDQIRLMHNGQLLDNTWSKLPKASKEMFDLAPRRQQDQKGSNAKP